MRIITAAQREANRKYMRKYRQRNPDRMREWLAKNPDYAKNWAANNRDRPSRLEYKRKYREEGRQRAKDYQRLYGITVEQYEEMLARQGGRCAICGADKPGNPRCKHFHVDHDHVTGRVRGLLCVPCNVHLGWLERRRVTVEAYLK